MLLTFISQSFLAHLPPNFSLGWALTHRLDLAAATQRKSLLRVLAEHCKDKAQARTLLFWTSRAGGWVGWVPKLHRYGAGLDTAVLDQQCRWGGLSGAQSTAKTGPRAAITL